LEALTQSVSIKEKSMKKLTWSVFAFVLCLAPVVQAVWAVTPSVSAGRQYSLALQADGSVWSWGGNLDGQLGLGDVGSPVFNPERVQTLSDIIAIAAGPVQSLAVKGDGTLWAWGNNLEGQVGTGDTSSPVYTPVRVQGLPDIIDAAAGLGHSLALGKDGTVWAWGSNLDGQLGIGNTPSPVFVPTRISGLMDVIDISAGPSHSLAVKSDGTVWAWGSNDSGQLGIGNTGYPVYNPARVQGLSDIIAVAAGGAHSLALQSDGTVWAWGSNDSEQVHGNLGDPVYDPARVQGLPSMVAIAAGEQYSMALGDDGGVWAWGANLDGQLGIGTTVSPVTPPERVFSLSKVVNIAAGAFHSLAAWQNGDFWAWGNNEEGQIGNGSTTESYQPTAVIGLGNLAPALSRPDVTFTNLGTEVIFQWSATAGAEGYILFYAPFPITYIGGVDMGIAQSLSVSLPSGLDVFVAVRAYNGEGNSDYSNIVEVLVP
jgi:alpha-tubulin suppressor-like RCC1 family protein